MYKRFYILVLTVLALASCTKEAVPAMSEVRFLATVSPEILPRDGGTRAVGAETVITDHAVLQAWSENVLGANVELQVTQGVTQIDFGVIKLAAGVDYDVYIWVDSKGYYNTSDLRNVCLATDNKYDGKSQEFDAFYSYTYVDRSQIEEVHNVTLKRPFAKLSFSAAVTKNAHISYIAPNGLNLKTGKVSGSMNVGYDVQHGDTDVEAFDYVFADEGLSQMNYTFKLGVEEEKTTAVPIARNTKTNIIYSITK